MMGDRADLRSIIRSHAFASSISGIGSQKEALDLLHKERGRSERGIVRLPRQNSKPAVLQRQMQRLRGCCVDGVGFATHQEKNWRFSGC